MNTHIYGNSHARQLPRQLALYRTRFFGHTFTLRGMT